MQMTLKEIADFVGGTPAGDNGQLITGLNSLELAGPNDLSFMRDARYVDLLEDSQAGAVLVPSDFSCNGKNCIQVPSPDGAFAMLLGMREREVRAHPEGIHPTAVIDESAIVGEKCGIAPHAVIGPDCIIGNGAKLYSGVSIGCGCRIGDDTIIYPNAVIREHCSVGARCIIHSNVSIGGDGFGFIPQGGVRHKIPQVGVVEIGNDVEIGANSAIDRATVGATRIGSGTKIDNLVQIGHNVTIGEHCAISGFCGIAGSTTIGNNVTIGGKVGIAGHANIGDNVSIGAGSGIAQSVEAGATVLGSPAIDHRITKRIYLSMPRLPDLFKRVRAIEQRIDRTLGTDDQNNG
jgi:UDP-3-O-[3-hydroxymyristoyl] glucosamine N-acyltransferase